MFNTNNNKKRSNITKHMYTYLNANANTESSTVVPVPETPTAETPTTPVAETSGKSKSRRLKYGTGLKVKRVVLIDGVPVGRGRPARGTIKGRTVVYIPVNATYDVAIYGTGSVYNAYRGIAPLKTVKKETYLANYPKAAAVVA